MWRENKRITGNAPGICETYHGLSVLRVFNLEIPWNIPILREMDQFASAFFTGLTVVCLPPSDVAMIYWPPLPTALAALIFFRLRGRLWWLPFLVSDDRGPS
jgi:acyl-CoA reductase-like NAD-dependent aldehyde dehydrogenase